MIHTVGQHPFRPSRTRVAHHLAHFSFSLIQIFKKCKLRKFVKVFFFFLFNYQRGTTRMTSIQTKSFRGIIPIAQEGRKNVGSWRSIFARQVQIRAKVFWIFKKNVWPDLEIKSAGPVYKSPSTIPNFNSAPTASNRLDSLVCRLITIKKIPLKVYTFPARKLLPSYYIHVL